MEALKGQRLNLSTVSRAADEHVQEFRQKIYCVYNKLRLKDPLLKTVLV